MVEATLEDLAFKRFFHPLPFAYPFSRAKREWR